MGKVALFLAVLVAAVGGYWLFSMRQEPNRAVDSTLIEAAHKNDLAALKKALDEGADVNAQVKKSGWDERFGEKTWEEGYTSLMYAANWGNTDALKLLLEKGANVNAQSDEGITALMCAAQQLQTEAVKLLLEKGADVRLKAKTGSSALDCARKRNVTPKSRKMEQIVADAMIKAGMDVKRPPDFSPGGGM